MKYIFFVSREIWPPFNSIYSYTKIKKEFPGEFLSFYTNEGNMKKVEKMLRILYEKNGKEIKIKKIKTIENVDSMRKMIGDMIEKGDIIDITGARKMMILSLMGIKNVDIVYLFLRDMRFSNTPFMMRPISIQNLMEVKR